MAELQFLHLNGPQKEVVLHTAGPLLVLAGAGSGKTNTMAYRIAHLVANRQVPARHILGLSFTNKAALELKKRVHTLLKPLVSDGGRHVFMGTFHSLCVRILRTYAHHLGYGLNFTVLDTSDQEEIVRQNSKSLGLDEKVMPARQQLYYFSLAKNQFLMQKQAFDFFDSIKGFSVGAVDHMKLSYERYQQNLLALNAMDFDDLIYNTACLLKQKPEACEPLLKRFWHIMVDEYQDTNAAQFEIVRLLNQHHQNLVVVGDDDQAIYAWRGASAEHILHFSASYPSSKTILLEQNYRSTNVILSAANAVIAKNQNRHRKLLWSDNVDDAKIKKVILSDDTAEVNYVVQQMLEKKDSRPWSAFAVLYRSNRQSRLFEQVFRSEKIPYKIIGGMSFLDRKEVRDVLAYLRVLSNKKDDAALRRIINWPVRGIGTTTLGTLTQLSITTHQSMMEILEKARYDTSFHPAARNALADFWVQLSQARMELLSLSHPQAVKDWVPQMLERFEIQKGIEAEAKDAVVAAKKWDNVQAVLSGLSYEKVSQGPFSAEKWLAHYCSKMSLQQDSDPTEETKNQVTLLTLHGAKGLEFDVVFLVGLEDGCLPHRRSLESLSDDLSEERRLLYVGMTRARHLLFLCLCKNRVRYGKEVPRIESRFLKDIPSDLLDISDQTLIVQDQEQLNAFFDEFKKRLFAP